MSNPHLDSQLWDITLDGLPPGPKRASTSDPVADVSDSCRALIEQSRRVRAQRQREWDALLADRDRVSRLALAFLSEASARLTAGDQTEAAGVE